MEALAETIEGIEGIEGLEQAGGLLDPKTVPEAIAAIKTLEELGRRVDAARADLMAVIDRRALYQLDGHYSAKVMVRHVAKLSPAEAATRAKTAKMLDDLPLVREAFRAGTVGTCQVRRIARLHANRRVRDRIADSEPQIVEAAKTKSYKAFDAYLTDWERRVDEDGTCDLNQRNHENRDIRLVQDFDQSWNLTGGCGSLQGIELHDVLAHQIDAELAADWDKARTEHGDAATRADLARTDNQRRFDAFFTIIMRGAANPDTASPQVVTNIVIDQTTFERHTTKLAGGQPEAPNPDDDTYRCDTFDGHPVEPTEAVANALVVLGRDVGDALTS